MTIKMSHNKTIKKHFNFLIFEMYNHTTIMILIKTTFSSKEGVAGQTERVGGRVVRDPNSKKKIQACISRQWQKHTLSLDEPKIRQTIHYILRINNLLYYHKQRW